MEQHDPSMITRAQAWGPLTGDIQYELQKQAITYQTDKSYAGVVVEDPDQKATLLDLTILDRYIQRDAHMFLVRFTLDNAICLGVAYIAWSHFCHSGTGDKIVYGNMPLLMKDAEKDDEVKVFDLENPEYRKLLAVSHYYVTGKKGTSVELARTRLWGKLSRMSNIRKVALLRPVP